MLVSQNKFAQIIKKSHTYVGKLVEKGVIVLVNKKVDVESAKKAIEEHKDPTRDAQREANDKRREEPTLMSAIGSYESAADITDEEKEELRKIKEEVQREKDAAIAAGIKLEDDPKDKDDEAFSKITGAAARAEKEYWLGQKAKIEYKRLKGEYMLVEDSEKQAFEAGRAVRDALLSLPPRLSPVFAGETDRFNIERLFLEEINQVLSGLCHEHE